MRNFFSTRGPRSVTAKMPAIVTMALCGLFGASAAWAATETVIYDFRGGNDGGQPIAQTYVNALLSFEQLEDISIVAAPGHSAFTDFAGIQQAVISHAERRRAYRIAVLDPDAACPAAAVADLVIVGSYDDPSAASRLADASDVVTYELEHVALDAARAVGADLVIDRSRSD